MGKYCTLNQLLKQYQKKLDSKHQIYRSFRSGDRTFNGNVYHRYMGSDYIKPIADK